MSADDIANDIKEVTEAPELSDLAVGEQIETENVAVENIESEDADGENIENTGNVEQAERVEDVESVEGDQATEEVSAEAEAEVVADAVPSESEQVTSEESILIDHQVDQPLIEPLSASEARHIQVSDADEVEEEDLVPDVLDMPPSELRGVVEALLLVSSKPLKIERIEKCLPGSCKNYLAGFMRGLSERYESEQRGWDLRSVGGGWQLLTRVQFHPWVRQLDKRALPTRLSKSAMETLAIVAYKQPVSRGRVEDIRGVQCGPMLRQLMDMHLIIVSGRDEEALGRPLLYATSEQFLERFGLSAAADLPRQHEFGG